MHHLLTYIFILSFFSTVKAQFNFNKREVDCIDKWVLFPLSKDSTHAYGFIYVDTRAGLTFNYEGSVKISPKGNYQLQKITNAGFKIRLEPNNRKVALIPAENFADLKIEPIPKWLSVYKSDSVSVDRLYRMGFIFNAWNNCSKGLEYLQKAQKINPLLKGLNVELAFSYNCLGDFENAGKILRNALKDNPADAYSNKELVYSLIQGGKLGEAAESCRKAIDLCKDQSYNGENCYNLLYAFYAKKDKKNFSIWLSEAKKWNAQNVQFLQSITSMEQQLEKL